ncbi:MAG: ATP-grasp domain-containing protein [Sphingobacteriales bacterium]|nr:ATP-grasp domain-containing protein [Sphingobacteriales bacterium]
MSSKKNITVAVTGLNNIDSPGPGIPVIRALKESTIYEIRIIGLSYETLEPGIYMHELVDKVYQIPMPSAGTGILLDRLKYINGTENIDVVIPNFDAELHNFIKLSPTLKSELGIATFLPTLEQFESRHKSVLFEFGEKNNVKVPYSKMIFNASEIHQLKDEFTYPLVIKGKYYDASIAATPEQAVNYFYKISAKWGLPIIVQEFVSGNEVNVTAIGDGNGKCIGAIPMRKLYITDKGKAWAGVSLDDEELIKITNRVIGNSKWRGGCELEFIKTNDNRYYLLEMNPRFPAWVYLSVGCGQNHPEALVQMALGEQLNPFTSFEKGKLFIRYSYDLIVNLSEFEKISTIGEL